ncbi:type III polyketide synthase [Crateriforma spongiae]|uniref:type III polyketide synthase n=1 Tax=Crateriforma spongiae TaxID=2724528 RepID=UPI0014489B3D|nr:type III polyketide synthase [Crateriforma spongiae]
MNVTLDGIGFAVPPVSICRQKSSEVAKQLSCSSDQQRRRLEALYRRSGVQSRGSVLLSEAACGTVEQDFFPPAVDHEDRGPTTAVRSQQFADHAPQLAADASRIALDESGLDPSQVTHLVVVTCTGFAAPGVDIELIQRLGLPAQTQRVQVGFMGCHGAINGLRAAQGLLAANENANVLLCCVELCSLHYQYGYDANRIVSGALFADGAAAMVLRRDSQKPSLATLVETGSCLVPDSRDAMTWKVGDHGFEMTLSATVPSLIEAGLVDFLTPWLAKRGHTIESIQGWAVHPGGTRILSAVESSLGLQPEQLATSRSVLSEHGNMSSATMPAVLRQFADRDLPRPWLMLGFGPGLEIEVALLE